MPYTETPETNALKQHIEKILATVPDFVEPAADKKQKPKLKIKKKSVNSKRLLRLQMRLKLNLMNFSWNRAPYKPTTTNERKR